MENTSTLFIVTIIFTAISIVVFGLTFTRLFPNRPKTLCQWCREIKTDKKNSQGMHECERCQEERFLKEKKKYQCPVCGGWMKNWLEGNDVIRECPKDRTIVLIPEDAENMIELFITSADTAYPKAI